MTSIAFRSPVTYPLHEYGWPRPPGSRDFRITQRFGDEDAYWRSQHPTAPPDSGPRHNATDIGNGHCGDSIVATMPGICRRVQDQAGALGIFLENGIVRMEFWHLDSWTIGNGKKAAPGQEVGKLGATGLGAVCHTHIELKVNGTRIDPEPHLFGVPLNVEDGVNIPGNLAPVARGSVGPRNRLRKDPHTTQDSKITDQTYWVQVYGFGVAGEPYTLGGKNGDRYAWIGVFGETWYVAEPLLTGLELLEADRFPTPPADCSAVVEQETRRLRNRINRKNAAIDRAAQAYEAGDAALTEARNA